MEIFNTVFNRIFLTQNLKNQNLKKKMVLKNNTFVLKIRDGNLQFIFQIHFFVEI